MQNVGKRRGHKSNHSLKTTEGEHYAKKKIAGRENHQRLYQQALLNKICISCQRNRTKVEILSQCQPAQLLAAAVFLCSISTCLIVNNTNLFSQLSKGKEVGWGWCGKCWRGQQHSHPHLCAQIAVQSQPKGRNDMKKAPSQRQQLTS